MAEYRDQDFSALGVQVAALSVDEPARAQAMRVQLGLPFPILCDRERTVITAWGLLNAAEHGGIAYPAVFIIDRDRTVRYRSLERTAARTSPEAVLVFLRSGRHSSAQPPKLQAIWPGLGTWATAVRNALRHGIRVRKE